MPFESIAAFASSTIAKALRKKQGTSSSKALVIPGRDVVLLDDIIYDITMWRIVLDTSVVVSAVRSRRGASAALLLQVGTEHFAHYLSVALLFEYESALKRPESGIELQRRAIDDILDYLAATAELQEIFFLWRPVLPDLADDHVLEVAVAGGCDAIVTYNRRDFRGAERFGVHIVTPREFLLELKG